MIGSYTIRKSLLTRRPLHLPTTEHVQVQMKDRLRTVFPVIYYQTKTIVQTFLLRHFSGYQHQMAEQSLVLVFCFRQLRNRFSWDYQEVYGSLGVDIFKCDTLIKKKKTKQLIMLNRR